LESQNLPNPEDPRRNGGQRIRTPLEEIPLWWADERGDEIRRNAEGSGFEVSLSLVLYKEVVFERDFGRSWVYL